MRTLICEGFGIFIVV